MFGRSELPDNLPRLRIYEQALSRYERTTPLTKGEDAGLIPLGDNRRYKRSQMLKNHNNGNIICRFWGTDVITYKPNGEIDLFIGGWSSPTTLMFLEGVLGPRFTRYKGKIYFDVNENHYLIHPDAGLTIKDGQVLNPRPEFAMKLNRGKMKDLQKQFAPFIGYFKSMAAIETTKLPSGIKNEMESLVKAYGYDYFANMMLSNNTRGHTEVPVLSIERKTYKWRPQHVVTRQCFFEKLTQACEKEDLDAMYPLYFILSVNAAAHYWDSSAGTYLYSVDKQRTKKYFDELIKFQYTTIFDKEEQPLGSLVADSNAKYFL